MNAPDSGSDQKTSFNRQSSDGSGGSQRRNSALSASDDDPNVLELAQEEARRLGHNSVSMEFILLGLLRTESTKAAVALHSCGISIDAVRKRTRDTLGEGSGFVAKEIPFSRESKQVLELSWEQASRAGSAQITAEHILLALLESASCFSSNILDIIEVDAEEVRNSLLLLNSSD